MLRISPMVCIPRIRFFFIDILIYLQKMSVNWFSQSGAEAVQKLAVLGHGLGQILRKIVLHKKFPPQLSLLFFLYIVPA